jgi:shikimate kinase
LRAVGAIHLAGPGGAGKSTVGRLLAERVGTNFVDLDGQFARRSGDIGVFLERYGYREYARHNVETYCSLARTTPACDVIALSSGFMTYPANIHAHYADVRAHIVRDARTFVLVPSLDRETCVAETVRRQLARPFTRSREKEEAAIRERFDLYMSLPARKVETMRPSLSTVEELLQFLRTETLRESIPDENHR